jgi:hypothetical protein
MEADTPDQASSSEEDANKIAREHLAKVLASNRKILSLICSIDYADGHAEHHVCARPAAHAFLLANQQTILFDRMRKDMRL